MARSLRTNDQDNYDGTQVPGYYQRTKLEDIINTFIMGYVGADKALQSVPRHEVAFWAQRAVAEFSYDVLHQDKSIELELNPQKVVKLPSDYVNYVKLTKTDNAGVTKTLQPAWTTKTNRAAVQDGNYDYVYDENGDIIYAQDSESVRRFQETDIRRATDYYNSYFYFEDYEWYDLKRFGNIPRVENQNGNYLLDNAQGLIYFDDTFNTDDIITLYYISDGLADNGDLANVYVPKMAEGAIYADILYNLAKLRPSLAGAVGLYKKEAMAMKRNTKIRLQNWKLEEVAQVMRGKSKWIKH